MKALTLTQPWASLWLTPRKRIETRSWPTQHRGPLAVHAAKGWTMADRKTAVTAGYASDALPRGAVIGMVYLIECAPIPHHFTDTAELFSGMTAVQFNEEMRWGNYAEGRYAWRRHESVLAFDGKPGNWLGQALTPAPARGALGLWEWAGMSDEMVAAYHNWLLEIRQ